MSKKKRVLPDPGEKDNAFVRNVIAKIADDREECITLRKECIALRREVEIWKAWGDSFDLEQCYLCHYPLAEGYNRYCYECRTPLTCLEWFELNHEFDENHFGCCQCKYIYCREHIANWKELEQDDLKFEDSGYLCHKCYKIWSSHQQQTK